LPAGTDAIATPPTAAMPVSAVAVTAPVRAVTAVAVPMTATVVTAVIASTMTAAVTSTMGAAVVTAAMTTAMTATVTAMRHRDRWERQRCRHCCDVRKFPHHSLSSGLRTPSLCPFADEFSVNEGSRDHAAKRRKSLWRRSLWRKSLSRRSFWRRSLRSVVAQDGMCSRAGGLTAKYGLKMRL
jgi:hypothetical protein